MLEPKGAQIGVNFDDLVIVPVQITMKMFNRRWPAREASPPLWAVVGAFAVSLLVGLVFGVLPARRAMKLDPVLALGRG